MRKWWFLCVFLVLWHLLGYALARRSGPAQWTDAKPDRSGAQRIVSVAPNLTELLYALDLDEAIVGVTLDSDYPPRCDGKSEGGNVLATEYRGHHCLQARPRCNPGVPTTQEPRGPTATDGL